MSKNIILISTSLIVCCLILGGFYYLVQIKKLELQERQHQLDVTSKDALRTTHEKALAECLDDVKEHISEMRHNYCILDKEELREDGTCFLSRERVDYLNARKVESSELCFKQYSL